ncbi:hypothetical protein KQ306_03885 [Synechococcus sp. CS-1324]|uniref:hypothetical protein n=1 Tax=Synechococcus sp. CS-1324 TaxID=2847980 RepID=UPI000DB126E5|nr:hypothetical protein [Synechococcus sp. CS-1324]MCT0230004.1 hypothetical protein [Synechococcus sp. CS-1324]PZV05564.1 MAG: hypothetical protein DCF23_02785 [Cyanobium sp.]
MLLDVDTAARQALAVDPALVLAGPRPRLLDEWQVEPALWNQVRRFRPMTPTVTTERGAFHFCGCGR